MNKTLTQCPFCGSEDLENLDSARYGGQVMCIDCGCMGPAPDRLEAKLGRDIPDGFEAWNIRK